MPDTPHSQAIFTIGFAAMPAARFANALRTFGIDTLVDVRPPAFTGHAPQFEPARVTALAGADGMRYCYLGHELGGLPEDPACYDAEGHVLYGRVARQSWFARGVRRVEEELAQGRRLALACVEADPRACHRRRLVGRVLRERGYGLAHILPGGGLISEAELLDEEAARLATGGRTEQPWRSAMSFPPGLRGPR